MITIRLGNMEEVNIEAVDRNGKVLDRGNVHAVDGVVYVKGRGGYSIKASEAVLGRKKMSK